VDEDSTRKVLGLARAVLRDTMGTDEEPSEMLQAMLELYEVDPADLELVQDALLFTERVLELVQDNLGNPQAFGTAMTLEVMGFVPELVADIEAIKAEA